MTDSTSHIMKLMPIWILLLVFISAAVEAVNPAINIIHILDKEWVQMLLISMGLGGIPLSMFKRVVKGAKEIDPEAIDLKKFMSDLKKIEEAAADAKKVV